MAKQYAIIVAINDYPGKDSDLCGCLNDAHLMASVLWDLLKWPVSSTRMLFNAEATKANIISALGETIVKAKPGDEILFHYSGHGSQVPCKNGDEADRLDEIICPYDYDQLWDNPLSDDVFRDLFKKKAPGAFLTCIFDSCHSATMSRSIARRNRFIHPPAQLEAACNWELPINRMGVKQVGYKAAADDMGHIAMSACKSNQTAADARFRGNANGAFTYYLCESIRGHGLDSRLHDVFMSAYINLKDGGFDQRPQIEGRRDLQERPFLGGPVK